jgi:hypothetical protein
MDELRWIARLLFWPRLSFQTLNSTLRRKPLLHAPYFSYGTIITLVTLNFGITALSVFFCFRLKLLPMRASSLWRLRRLALWLSLDLFLAAAVLALSVMADSSAKVRSVPAGGCYCGCALSKTSAGCGKMCELPKYASRPWAVTCVKPRASAPIETPDARPHLPHLPRNERASN